MATTLLAAGASHAQIQALCRWQTSQSLAIYARMSANDYGSLLDRAMAAKIDSARADHLAHALPFLDMRDVLRSIQAAGQSLTPTRDLDLDTAPAPDDDADLDECAGSNEGGVSPRATQSTGATPSPVRTMVLPRTDVPATTPIRSPRSTVSPRDSRLPANPRAVPHDGQRIRVFWTEERSWFVGVCTSTRCDPHDSSRLLSRVVYDPSPPWRAETHWHHLETTTWLADDSSAPSPTSQPCSPRGSSRPVRRLLAPPPTPYTVARLRVRDPVSHRS